MSHPPDQALFLSYKKGDIQSFERLYERYRLPVYDLILAHTGSTLDAAEVLKNIFFKIHLLRSRIVGGPAKRHHFAQWLFVISLSEINRFFNGSPMVSFATSPTEEDKPKDLSGDFQSQLKTLESNLDAEKEKHLHMKFIDGLAFEEIAAELGISKEDDHSRPWLKRWERFLKVAKEDSSKSSLHPPLLDPDLRTLVQKDILKDQIFSKKRILAIFVISLVSLALAVFLF